VRVPAQSTALPLEEIPEVVVRAQKREQLAQHVPISMSVVRGEDIDRLADADFHDLLLSIPGVFYSGEESGLSRRRCSDSSTVATARTVRSTSSLLVRQLTTLIRIARRRFHIVPLKNAVPSQLIASIIRSVRASWSEAAASGR
jgi:hypothetical protein